MNVEQNKAIGIFDSGIGGLTVFKAIEEALPNEHLIYLGDTARVPYGNKSRETITRYSIENTQFLMKAGVKAVVVACNTASALALHELQKQFSIPMIGVIEPGAQAAVAATKTGEVGIIGTEATLASGSYTKAIQVLNPKTRVWGVSCPLFVPLAEEGWVEDEISIAVAKKYLAPFLKTPIDILILGCTHYPILKKMISKVMGPEVKLVDSAEQTALALKTLLQSRQFERKDSTFRQETLFLTDSPARFNQVGRNFLNRSLEGVTLVTF